MDCLGLTMRGLASPAFWLVPVLARAASIALAGVQLQGTKNADFLVRDFFLLRKKWKKLCGV